MRRYQLCLFILAPLLLSSCGPRLYFPDRANVPGFKKARELKVTASVKAQDADGSGGAIASPAADVAYAPVNHLGIISSWRALDGKSGYLYPVHDKPSNYSFNNTNIGLSGQRFELGAGYFTSIGRKTMLEAYGGYGRGTLTGANYFKTDYNRFFVQSEAGYRNKVVSVIGGMRLAMQKYNNFRSPDSSLRYTINEDYAHLRPVDFTGETFLFIEPFVNFEVGHGYFSFNTQIGISAEADNNVSIIGDSNIYLSMGLVFHFSPR